MNYAIVIPARFQSSRFPGKPLADILGKPMIQRVWERCVEATSPSTVYVATDNSEIRGAAEAFGARVVMTSSDCLTGTDRLAEANLQLDCDFIVNVQGDEPLVDPNDIKKVIQEYLVNPGQIVNAMCPIDTETEFRSLSVPKVVVDKQGRLMYMSRSPIPVNKAGGFCTSYRQVCIYAFSREHLKFFRSNPVKSPLELIEDIEILRFLEHGMSVKMIVVSSASIAVDFPEDAEKVRQVLRGSEG